MNNFEYYSPTKVTFGKDVEMKVGNEIRHFSGTKVLIHYGSQSAKRSGLLDRIIKNIKSSGLGYVLLGDVQPNPRLSLVHEGIKLCRKEGVDFILAIGGGSVIDSAKAIALGVPFDGDVWDFYDGKELPNTALPHANVLTIASAGSETSSSSVITNENGWYKKGINTELNRPRFTLMNPELLYTLPSYQTGCGIVDTMMHTMDRYFSPGGINELTDSIAEALLRTVIKYGAIAIKEPNNYDARSELMWAGSLSHNHLTGLGRLGDWAPHQIEHELSGKFDVTHAAGLSAIWTSWANYVYKEDIMRFVRFGINVWGLSLNKDNPEETAIRAIKATKNYFESIEMPTNLIDLLGRKATMEEMRDMAIKATYYGKRTLGKFKVLGENEIYDIYEGANSLSE